MTRSYFQHSSIAMLVVILVLTFTISWNVTAQKTLSSLSGRVIDADGKPVAGLKLAIKPVKINRGYEEGPLAPIASWPHAVTDKKGIFSITNINPVSSRVVMFPEHGSDYEIISLELGNITVYSTAFRPNFPVWFGKPTIAIEPGEHLENVVVNVQKPRMRISGRVVLPDGTPLANKVIYLTVRHRHRDTFLFFFSGGGGGGSSGGSVKTDSEGYFVTYSPDDEEEYMVSVKYEGETAKTRWFRMKKGQRKDNLKLTLRGFEKHKLNREKARQAVWTVNPENQHAYRRIECDSWEDAKAKAQNENAYLVAINDEAEQKWLESLYSERVFFWIGLQVPEKGEAWRWNSGELFTYANWGPSGKPDNISTSEGKVPIALIFSTKKWMAIDSKNPLSSMVKKAIIEKNNF
ncbi:MAG: lectin-like protein [Candidatus Poribacteria bacterium]|nr:lectin-like protein [Candidatus Poribacteria bacterium]